MKKVSSASHRSSRFCHNRNRVNRFRISAVSTELSKEPSILGRASIRAWRFHSSSSFGKWKTSWRSTKRLLPSRLYRSQFKKTLGKITKAGNVIGSTTILVRKNAHLALQNYHGIKRGEITLIHCLTKNCKSSERSVEKDDSW